MYKHGNELVPSVADTTRVAEDVERRARGRNESCRPLSESSGDAVEVALLHSDDELLPFDDGVAVGGSAGIGSVTEDN